MEFICKRLSIQAIAHNLACADDITTGWSPNETNVHLYSDTVHALLNEEQQRSNMPTVVTHAVVGLAAGTAVSGQKMPARFWVLSAVCPMLPDLDVLAFVFKIPYAHPFGHRGFSHSLTFALIVGLLVTIVFFRKERLRPKRFMLLSLYFFLITATHGVLDAMTNGGLGVALLAPFDNTRYFMPWRPIQVSPIGIRRFFSHWGLMVALSELLWVWTPSIVIVAIVKWVKGKKRLRPYFEKVIR